MMTLAQIILSIAVMFGSSFSTLDINRSKGCTAPLLLPDKPFLVIWNHPTSSCKAKGIDLNFEEWGIVDNSKDAFIGEQIALFYDLGQYPRFSDSRIVNGGIPQLGNLTYHLQKVDTDLNSIIPSASFSGLGVIDFESWRPLYYLNFDSLRIYQQKSLELAKQKFPGYNSTQLLHEAVEEFDEAARLFIETTLQKVSDLRQSGRWGYYGYPRCWDTYCNSSTVGVNDQMSWIYNLSSGLYPSIYFSAGRPENVTANYVRNIILETLRVKSKWSPQDAAILPYAYIQNGPYSFFTETYLSYSIQEPANMGSSGVVLWGSSRNIQDKNECIALQEYLNNTLGPFALQLTNFFANCSQQLCQSHGRCVKIDYEQFSQYHLQKSGRTECLSNLSKKKTRTEMAENKMMNMNQADKNNIVTSYRMGKANLDINNNPPNPNNNLEYSDEEFLTDFDDYVCRCFVGWSGTHCENPI